MPSPTPLGPPIGCSVPSLKAAEVRQMLAPIFDFEKHSASEQYVDKLPEPIKKAIKEQRAIEGMVDALGRKAQTRCQPAHALLSKEPEVLRRRHQAPADAGEPRQG